MKKINDKFKHLQNKINLTIDTLPGGQNTGLRALTARFQTSATDLHPMTLGHKQTESKKEKRVAAIVKNFQSLKKLKTDRTNTHLSLKL